MKCAGRPSAANHQAINGDGNLVCRAMPDYSQHVTGAPGPDPLQDRTDRSLLRLVREGDEAAAARIYHRYARRLLAFARSRANPNLATRLDAEDIVQSVFRRFFNRVQSGDYEVLRREELWPLFLAIALNRIRTAHQYHQAEKRDVRRTQASDDLDRCSQYACRTMNDSLQVLELVVAETLGKLPEQHRRVVELRFAGYEMAEIADQIGRSMRTTERLLQESREMLKAMYDGPQ